MRGEDDLIRESWQNQLYNGDWTTEEGTQGGGKFSTLRRRDEKERGSEGSKWLDWE